MGLVSSHHLAPDLPVADLVQRVAELSVQLKGALGIRVETAPGTPDVQAQVRDLIVRPADAGLLREPLPDEQLHGLDALDEHRVNLGDKGPDLRANFNKACQVQIQLCLPHRISAHTEQ